MRLINICVALFVITLFFISPGFAQRQAAKPDAPGDRIRRRMEWFYHQRAYPLKRIPGGVRLKALKQLDEMLAGEARSATPSADLASESAFDVSSAAVSSTRWTLIGPEPTVTPYNVPVVAGRVSALTVSPGTQAQCEVAAMCDAFHIVKAAHYSSSPVRKLPHVE